MRIILLSTMRCYSSQFTSSNNIIVQCHAPICWATFVDGVLLIEELLLLALHSMTRMEPTAHTKVRHPIVVSADCI